MVWIGGVALALGGIYLVRYSIEQGLIGRAVRCSWAACWRWRWSPSANGRGGPEKLSGFPGLPTAHIPSILTAAGTTVAYATVYAAYGLYGFLPPAVALHPARAGRAADARGRAAAWAGARRLGLVGAYVAPILRRTPRRRAGLLGASYIYLAVVTAAAFTLARFRLWRWLAVTAIIASALWTFPGTDLDPVDALGAHVFHALAGFVLASLLIVSGLFYGPPAEPGRIDRTSTLALSVFLLVSALLVLASLHDTVALTAFVALTVATVAIVWVAKFAAGAVAVAAILAAMVDGALGNQSDVGLLLAPSGPTAAAVPEPERFAYGSHLALGFVWAACSASPGFFLAGPLDTCHRADAVSASGVRAARHPDRALLSHLPFRAVAAVCSARPAARRALRLRDRGADEARAAARHDGIGREPSATGALAALALAFTFALEKGWLTVALALMAPGAAWIAEKRPLPWLALARRNRWRGRGRAHRYEPRIVGRRRHRADLQLAALRLRHSRGGVRACRLAAAQARGRSALANGRCRRGAVHRAARDRRNPPPTSTVANYPASTGITEHILYVNVGLASDDDWPRARARAHRQRRAQRRRAADAEAAVTLCLIVFELDIDDGAALRQYAGRRPVLQPDPARLPAFRRCSP